MWVVQKRTERPNQKGRQKGRQTERPNQKRRQKGRQKEIQKSGAKKQ